MSDVFALKSARGSHITGSHDANVSGFDNLYHTAFAQSADGGNNDSSQSAKNDVESSSSNNSSISSSKYKHVPPTEPLIVTDNLPSNILFYAMNMATNTNTSSPPQSSQTAQSSQTGGKEQASQP